ncbi:terminase-like family protein [Vibrio phage 496E54-1]|nr:terminase-like family protein [Vibrio phage 496E54-1]CAH9011431.1 terminase-like family protein [Vibrio phage 495E54-1]
MSYKCAEDVRPQEGKQSDVFRVIAEQKADFILLTGGRSSGKTELITMADLLFAGDANFRSVKFRRTYKQLTRAGGLWQKAHSQYKFFNAVPNKSDLIYKFPSGAETAFSYCDNMNDAESWRGSELSMIAFDEINHHEWDQISMLQTCLRSQADMSSMMIGTCNPDEDSWVYQLFLKGYYIDEETGFPIEERNGKIRYYIIDPVTEKPVFADDLEFFEEHYPEIIRPVNPVTGVQMYVEPKKFCFFSLCIWDNPIAQKLNPKYVAELVALPPYKRDTQLYGNWLAKATKNNMFKREFLRGLSNHEEYGFEYVELPKRRTTCRAWDLAYTEPSQANKYPDYTASVKIHRCNKGYYYIDGGWHPDLYDTPKDSNDTKELGRFRKNVGTRDEWMLKQARYDERKCTVIIPKASAAGKAEFEQLKVMFVNEGFKVNGAATGNAAGAKALRFYPFCSAAEQGLVFILKDTFRSDVTLEAFLTELEDFEEGFKSTSKRKDDWVDATSDAFSTLQGKKLRGKISAGESTNTKLADYRSKH